MLFCQRLPCQGDLARGASSTDQSSQAELLYHLCELSLTPLVMSDTKARRHDVGIYWDVTRADVTEFVAKNLPLHLRLVGAETAGSLTDLCEFSLPGVSASVCSLQIMLGCSLLV